MGQEFAARTPFGYFADYRSPVAETLWAGRRRELAASEQFAGEAAQSRIRDPSAAETFLDSKLDWKEREDNAVTCRLYAALLALRRDDAVLAQRPHAATDGAVLSAQAFVFRWFDGTLGDRLLIVNLGSELSRGSVAEPLLAPPQGRRWHLCWSSEDPQFGGLGIVRPETEEGWFIGAEAASFFRALPIQVGEAATSLSVS
jgi:maltooligosyltrehalose trehalohydrolase